MMTPLSRLKHGLPVVGAALVAASCGQPAVPCSVGHFVPYAAKYTFVESSGTCGTADDDVTSAAELKGDLIGFSSYNAPSASGRPDPNAVSFAMRTVLMGTKVATAEGYGIVDADTSHAPEAFAPFSSATPDENDLCTPAGPLVTEQVLAEVPADPGDPADPEDDFDGQPATSMRETWNNVELYVTAAALGTQMRGQYTLEMDGCTATYNVLAVYPGVSCDNGDGTPNVDLCSPVALPDKGIPVGSGISPDFPTVCDPDLLLCVLDGDGSTFPVLKPAG